MKLRQRFSAGASLLALLALLGIAIAPAIGCGGAAAPHGAPVLLKVYWEAWDVNRTADPLLVWSNDPNATIVSPVPPGPRRVDFIFDKVLDGSKIEDTADGGMQVQKADPPITFMIDDPAADNGVSPLPSPFQMNVWYNSIPLITANFTEAPGTSYVFGQEMPSFPSSTNLKIQFVHAGITSEYNEPMKAPDDIVVATEAFKLMPAAPPAQVLVNYWLPLPFNTLPADTADLLSHVQVTTGGAPLSFQLMPEPLDPRLIYVQPAAGGVWPSGATVDVTVGADLPDRFGATLGAPVSLSFNPCRPVSDKSTDCVLAADAGAVDAGTDVGAGAPDAGAADDAAAVD